MRLKNKISRVTERMNAYSTRGYEKLTENESFTEAEYRPGETEPLSYVSYSYWRSSVRIFSRNKTAMFFLALITLTLMFTFIQPYLPGQKDPALIHNDASGMQIRNRAPDEEFIFGTNSIGQDSQWPALKLQSE